jgi:Phage integrase family
MWHRLTTAAGVRPIRLHDARHSCGTVLHLRDVPLAVIAKWLGHADASITARIYAHSQDEALVAAAKSLGEVVSSSCHLGFQATPSADDDSRNCRSVRFFGARPKGFEPPTF